MLPFEAPMHRPKSVAAVCGAMFLSWTLAAPSAACPGDCDNNSVVRVDELIRGVDISLAVLPLRDCPAFDCQNTGTPSLVCVVQAVAASVSGCPRSPTPSPTASPTAPPSTPTPTATSISLPRAPVRLILQEQPAALLSISGTSAADVYTVGADTHDGMGPYVLHYDGQSWHRLITGKTGNLWWISVTPIDGSFYMAGEGGLVLRYQLSAHAFAPLPTLGTENLLFGIWGTDANHIWAVGAELSNQGSSGVVWRFDGTRWTSDAAIGKLIPEGLPILYKVWGRDEKDLYVVGDLGVVFHFDGAVWTRSTVDLGGAMPSDSPLFTVHGNATRVEAVGGLDNGLILESQGASFANGASPQTPQMNGVFIRPDDAGVAVGIAGALAFRGAGGWQLQSPGVDTGLDFHGSWIDPEGGVWAVGGNLTTDLNRGILAYGGLEMIGTNIEAGS